jgi:hypothetical protein
MKTPAEIAAAIEHRVSSLSKAVEILESKITKKPKSVAAIDTAFVSAIEEMSIRIDELKSLGAWIAGPSAIVADPPRAMPEGEDLDG